MPSRSTDRTLYFVTVGECTVRPVTGPNVIQGAYRLSHILCSHCPVMYGLVICGPYITKPDIARSTPRGRIVWTLHGLPDAYALDEIISVLGRQVGGLIRNDARRQSQKG